MASLPWQWVIEALADLKAADTSVLREVISKVPGFSTDAPESARERVALRYLEEQCSRSGGDLPSASGNGSGIDMACSSEEILCRKVAAQASRERDRHELSNHDLRQFILQKKAALPKSSLDLLKESIVEGHSLKDSSGLFKLNEVDYMQCNNGGEHEHVDTFKLSSSSSSQSHSGLQGPMTLDTVHGSVEVQEEPARSEKHLSQENVSDLDMGNKLCGNIVSTGTSDAQLLEKGSIHQLSENIGCNGGEIHSANQADGQAFGNSSPSLRDPSASWQNLPEWNVSDCERRNNAQQMRQSSPPLLPCREKTSLQHGPLNASENIVNQSNCQNDNFDREPNVVPETQSEGRVSDDTFDSNDDIVTSEKDRLLASQIHANPDSMAGEWSEQGLCIKCDKGGQLLSCSARGCVIAVHESCLFPSVNFIGTGLFYCPFCSYTRASIAYCKARKNVFRARKALSAFVGRDLVQVRRKKLPPASTIGRTSEAGVNENTNHLNSFHSEEDQRKKLNNNPVKSKEQDHGRRDANVCYDHNLSSRCSVPPQSDVRYDVSHNAAELTRGEMVNGQQDNTDMQSINNASKAMDTGKLPRGVKVTAPIHEKADAALNNRQCEEGNGSEFNGLAEHQHPGQPDATTENGSLHHEASDIYQIRYHDASRAQQKDVLSSVNERAHVEKLKNEEQLRVASNKDTWREASTSNPSRRHAKRRYGVTIGKRRHAQEADENTNTEKNTSGIRNNSEFPESQQVMVSPDNGNDPKALNTQLNERYAKRRRHDAAMHKINDPPENFEKQEREKSSPGRSSKRIAQPKPCYNPQTMLGRRQKLFWTSEEEEILKEAVQRFGDRDGNCPWTQILEFGRHVFHRTRQPGDLKDKWRNIKKKEVKQEM